MSAILQIARDEMRRELKRYDTRDIHVTLERLNTPVHEDPKYDLVLGMSFIGPGLGADAPYGQAERAIDMRRFRAAGHSGLYAAIREAVVSMCAELFGVHEGSGLP